MKLLITLPDGAELYSAGDSCYRVKITSKGWVNMCGIDYEGRVETFTSNGWTCLFQYNGKHKYVLPRQYTNSEKEAEQKAFNDFKSEILSYVIAFHDG